MAQPLRRNIREIDTLLNNGRQAISCLIEQLQAGQTDPLTFAQNLGALQKTLDQLAEDRSQATQNERLARLYTVSRLIGTSIDLQTVLEQVMDAIIQLTHAEHGFLMLQEEGKLNIRVARNFDRETLDKDASGVSRTVTNRVLETGTAVITTNAQEDTRFSDQESVIAMALSSIMASPLRLQDKVIGVIYVDNRALKGLFVEDDLQLLDMFGDQAAIAIGNALQVQEREAALKHRISELEIVIDQAKRERQVNEITETDYFKTLRGKITQLRRRGKQQDAD
jgi:sigma-B regulation protein RsbU (phosphoserine phosphatase)